MNHIRSRFVRLSIVSALSVFAVGCNSTSAPGYAIGEVGIVATDDNGAPADQVHVNLMLPDKATIWRTAVTGSDGKAQFGTEDGGVLVQDYLVFFPIQTQWALAADETNYKPANAVENQTVTVQFKVHKIEVNPR
ncbi:MAG: hypothetical protein ABR582_08840 [Gemmatimonadaceae bacterium]